MSRSNYHFKRIIINPRNDVEEHEIQIHKANINLNSLKMLQFVQQNKKNRDIINKRVSTENKRNEIKQSVNKNINLKKNRDNKEKIKVVNEAKQYGDNVSIHYSFYQNKSEDSVKNKSDNLYNKKGIANKILKKYNNNGNNIKNSSENTSSYSLSNLSFPEKTYSKKELNHK